VSHSSNLRRRIDQVRRQIPGMELPIFRAIIYTPTPEGLALADQTAAQIRAEMGVDWHGALFFLPEVDQDETDIGG
jgi:hypothetical protein